MPRTARLHGNVAPLTGGRGIPLVHFSAQPELFFILKSLHRLPYPTKGAHVKPKSGRVWALNGGLGSFPALRFSGQRGKSYKLIFNLHAHGRACQIMLATLFHSISL